MMLCDVVQNIFSHTETQAATGQNGLYSEVALAKICQTRTLVAKDNHFLSSMPGMVMNGHILSYLVLLVVINLYD